MFFRRPESVCAQRETVVQAAELLCASSMGVIADESCRTLRELNPAGRVYIFMLRPWQDAAVAAYMTSMYRCSGAGPPMRSLVHSSLVLIFAYLCLRGSAPGACGSLSRRSQWMTRVWTIR